jgi:hypothetical protein
MAKAAPNPDVAQDGREPAGTKYDQRPSAAHNEDARAGLLNLIINPWSLRVVSVAMGGGCSLPDGRCKWS